MGTISSYLKISRSDPALGNLTARTEGARVGGLREIFPLFGTGGKEKCFGRGDVIGCTDSILGPIWTSIEYLISIIVCHATRGSVTLLVDGLSGWNTKGEIGSTVSLLKPQRLIYRIMRCDLCLVKLITRAN